MPIRRGKVVSSKRPSVSRRRKFSAEELLSASSALAEDSTQLRSKLPIASGWKAPEVHERYEALRARGQKLSREIDRAGLNAEQFRHSMTVAAHSLRSVKCWLDDYRTLHRAMLKTGRMVDGLARRIAAEPMKSIFFRHRRYKALRYEWGILMTLARAMGVFVDDRIEPLVEKFTFLAEHFRNVPSKDHTWKVISRLGLTTTDLQVLGFSILSCKCSYCYYSCNPSMLRQEDKAVQEQLFDEIENCLCKFCETTRKGLLLLGSSFLGSTKTKRRWASEILSRLGRHEHNN